jgi:hypothetical protein
VVRPERFDLNKDRKLSKKEIKKAIYYVIYPKEEKKRIGMDPILIEHVKNNVDLFVKNIKKSHLNYKQFAYLMSKISANQFVNVPLVENMSRARREQRESEGEL